MFIESSVQAQTRASRIVAGLDEIATLPEVTGRIISTVNDPKSSPKDLHRIISHDPALVTRILKLVNSSFYSRTTKIDSVERAIVLLGFDAIQHLAIAASMGQLFKGVRLCDEFTARDLWTHSIAVGVVAREMAKLYKKEVAEEAFLAGLVHDMGLLASMQLFPKELRMVCEAAQGEAIPFVVLEQDIIGVDHQDLGEALAKRWKFPAVCQAVAGHHHHPSHAEDDARMIAALVHVADVLCCQERVGFNLTAVHQQLEESNYGGLVPLPIIHSTSEGLQGLVWTAVRIFG